MKMNKDVYILRRPPWKSQNQAPFTAPLPQDPLYEPTCHLQTARKRKARRLLESRSDKLCVYGKKGVEKIRRSFMSAPPQLTKFVRRLA